MLEFIKNIAIRAGEAIMEVYSGDDFQTSFKEGNMPLTIADKKANDIIVRALAEKYPEYAILSEEEKDNKERLNNDYCFIVDPLDGTKEFIKRNGQFTVNIALTYKKRSILGVIYVPVTQELYFASEGEGAFYEKNGMIEKIHVSDKLTDLTIVSSSSHSSEKETALLEKNKDKISKSIQIGSSLKGCLVAKGDADIYYRFNPTMEWDTAAMQCIVEEAGGIFKQMDDTDMLYNRENSVNDKGFYILNKIENYMKG